MAQKLITREIAVKLLRNSQASKEAIGKDGEIPGHMPVLKLFTPWTGYTWLITEMDGDRGYLFGLCDLGQGQPELGYINLSELEALRGPFGLKIERDIYWTADKTLSAYADEARALGRIAA